MFKNHSMSLLLVILSALFSPGAFAADYVVTLTATQEVALAEATEQANLRVGIVYATGVTVTSGSTTVTLKAATAAWKDRWFKVTGDTTYYRITAVTTGASITLATAYTGTSGAGKDCTIHQDNGATPTSAAVPDKTKTQVLQGIAEADLANVLRNLDARITPVLPNIKALDAATQGVVLSTDPSPATRARAMALAAQP